MAFRRHTTANFFTLAIAAVLFASPNIGFAAWVADPNYAFPSWDTNAPNDPQQNDFKPITNNTQTYDIESFFYVDDRTKTTDHTEKFQADGGDVAWAKSRASYNTDTAKVGQGLYDPDYSLSVSIVINSTDLSTRYSDGHDGLPQWDDEDSFEFAEFKEQAADWEGTLSITEDYMGEERTIVYTIDTPAHGQNHHLGRHQGCLVVDKN